MLLEPSEFAERSFRLAVHGPGRRHCRTEAHQAPTQRVKPNHHQGACQADERDEADARSRKDVASHKRDDREIVGPRRYGKPAATHVDHEGERSNRPGHRDQCLVHTLANEKSEHCEGEAQRNGDHLTHKERAPDLRGSFFVVGPEISARVAPRGPRDAAAVDTKERRVRCDLVVMPCGRKQDVEWAEQAGSCYGEQKRRNDRLIENG